MKMKKKIMVTILTVILMLSSMPVMALDTSNSESGDVKAAFTIEVDSEEEAQEILEYIEKQNAKAEALWQEALSRQCTPIKDTGISPFSFATTDTANSSLWYGFAHATLYCNATYNRLYNGSTPIFGDIYGISVWSSSGPVSNVITNYSVIDQYRTLAVNLSCVVAVQTSISTNYISVTKYAEFYAGGGCTMY